MNKQDQYCIVHLSDLHLTSADNLPRTEPKLYGALTGMNAAFRRILQSPPVQDADLIVVTGDVTDSGQMAEWQIFWEAVRAAGLSERLLVVPGNHDICCLGARLPTASGAEDGMKRAVSGLQFGNQLVRFPWVKVFADKVAVFGLNSNNVGNFSGLTNAQGELSYYQLKTFANHLYKYRDIPVKLVALHHSPNIPEKATALRRGVEPMSGWKRLAHQLPEADRRALLLLCLCQRVRVVMHGHVHREEKREISGIRIVGAPATTEPHPRKNGAAPEYRFWRYIVKQPSQKVFCEVCAVAVA